MPLLVEGLGRFETCINSTKRAMRILHRLTSTRQKIGIDRTLRGLLQSHERVLTRFRDAIEHIDEQITGLSSGQPHLLAIDRQGKCLEIADERLSLVQLASAVRSLYRAAVDILGNISTADRPLSQF